MTVDEKATVLLSEWRVQTVIATGRAVSARVRGSRVDARPTYVCSSVSLDYESRQAHERPCEAGRVNAMSTLEAASPYDHGRQLRR